MSIPPAPTENSLLRKPPIYTPNSAYDFIAFTDHDYLLKSSSDDTYASVKSDLIIFKGVELTVFEKGYVHVNQNMGGRRDAFISSITSESTI